jgi:hypothetical protein
MGEVAVLSSRAVGGHGGVVLGHGNPIFQGAVATPNMYSMLPHKQNIATPPEVCYEMSMVCAKMACICYMLESSECGSSGQIFFRAWACSW